jgi:hypothetical protein
MSELIGGFTYGNGLTYSMSTDLDYGPNILKVQN